jgi:dephospho-CoA kinase
LKIVGLTGGIGSGKTTVARMFKELGVAVYIADKEAKKLTNSSKVIKRKLIKLLGKSAYENDSLNRKFVADTIFNDPELLQKTNEIIHPKVAQHFKKWLLKQEGNYCIKEAAILFENGGYKKCDYTILITAPKTTRIQRIMNRDDATKKEIEARMNNQWSDEKKKELADFVIENTDLERTENAVKRLHILLCEQKK